VYAAGAQPKTQLGVLTVFHQCEEKGRRGNERKGKETGERERGGKGWEPGRGAMLNYACKAGEAGKAGNGYTATFWRRRQPLW